MGYTVVTIKDARESFSELIEQAALAHKTYLVTKFGKPKAMIVPADKMGGQIKLRRKALEETAGLWADRKEMKDSGIWVSKRRAKESSRYGKIFS